MWAIVMAWTLVRAWGSPMSTYINRILSANERVTYEAKLHWIIFVWPILCTVLTLGMLLPWLIWAILIYFNTDVAVTDRRLISKTGLLSRRAVELRLTKVESIRVDQSIIGRMLDYGTVIVTGTGISHAPFKGIMDPLAFKRAVDVEVERIEQADKGLAHPPS